MTDESDLRPIMEAVGALSMLSAEGGIVFGEGPHPMREEGRKLQEAIRERVRAYGAWREAQGESAVRVEAGVEIDLDRVARLRAAYFGSEGES